MYSQGRVTYLYCSYSDSLPKDGWMQNCYACGECVTTHTMDFPHDEELVSRLKKPTSFKVYVCPGCQVYFSKNEGTLDKLWQKVRVYIRGSRLINYQLNQNLDYLD